MVGLAVLAGCFQASSASGFERDALGHVIATCAFSKQTVGMAFPCLKVVPGEAGVLGYAVVRGPRQRSEVLVVPLDPVSGIEDPHLLVEPYDQVWQAGWRARQLVFDALGRILPRDAIGLAVNSTGGRSQDQFHLHVDCIKPQVRRILAAKGGLIGEGWRRFPARLAGDAYWARFVPGSDLKGVDVAALLVRGLPGARKAMARVSVAVAATPEGAGKAGFYLLANKSNSAAEVLLDHACSGL